MRHRLLVAVVLGPVLLIGCASPAAKAPPLTPAPPVPSPEPAASPAASPAPSAGQSGALDVDGYRFDASLVTDPRYGPEPTAGPWAVSGIAGAGVRCRWTRTGPDVADVNELWGSPFAVSPTGAGYGIVRTGTGGDNRHGVPLGAVIGSRGTSVCAVSDADGRHGVVVELTVPPSGDVARSTIGVSRWSGILLPAPSFPPGGRFLTFTPAAAPVCSAPPAPSIPPLLATVPGPVATRVVRDDAWTRPPLVPAQYLMYTAAGTVAYEQVVCHDVYAYGYGTAEGTNVLRALDPIPSAFRQQGTDTSRPASLANPTAALGLQLWLMDVHFVSMRADARGTLTLAVERRKGFEIVIFDLEAVAVSPHRSGSLHFRFTDDTGAQVLPPIVRDVRASWEYGRAPAP